MMTNPTPQPDSPEDILADLHTEHCAFKRFTARNSDDIVAATHYCEKYRREALTKLDEYYTNKFLEIIGEDEDPFDWRKNMGMKPDIITPAINQYKAELKQAIKQLSKRGE